jgi:hypothetical protein
MEDSETDFNVDDIVSQLQNSSIINRPQSVPEEEISKENLEEFIIKKSALLINKTLHAINNVQDYISSAPDAKDVSAFAELLNAASGSIDALNKVYTSIEKNKTSKEIKTMDIQSKERMNTQDNVTTLLSRQEVLEAITKKDPDIIDLEDQS